MRLDPTAGRGPSSCAVLESRADAFTGFVTLAQTARVDTLRGRRLRLSAWIKAEKVGGWSGLWMRIDRASGTSVAFDNMQDRPVSGTADWTCQSIVLDVPHDAEKLSFGIILEGSGRVLADDFEFALVGEEVPTTGFPRPEGRAGERP